MLDDAPLNLIIVGAPRSGTNMLRDVLAAVPGVSTWPCDEINYVWRHGNRDHPDDELPIMAATPSVRRYVERSFAHVRRRNRTCVVVEKTCATSLRVPFVDALLPSARYVFIHRDGIDAAASAARRWNADVDLSYVLRKARFVPPEDLAHYARQFLRGRLGRSTMRSAHTWGPRFLGMDAAVVERPLDEVCALQWQRCVELSLDALGRVDQGRVHTVSYEDYVTAPVGRTQDILDFAGIDHRVEERLVADVRTSSVGSGYRDWSADRVSRVSDLVGNTQDRRVC